MATVKTNGHIDAMIANELKFNFTKHKVIKEAKKIYGDNIFDDIYLPKNYNLENLDVDLAKEYDLQECKLPFDEKTIKTLIKMPKILVNEVFNFNHKGKSIHGSFLIGKNNGKYCLFLLKIINSSEHNDFSDFSIKLDACIQGKAWLSLLRLDSSGNPHPNYIKDGKVVKTPNDLTFVRTPHLHKTDYITQILADTKSYSLATELPFFDYENQNVTDKYMFKKIVNYFLKNCNIKAKINEVVKNDYLYSKTKPLFDYDIPYINKPDDLNDKEF